jgi:hypothetical protein
VGSDGPAQRLRLALEMFEFGVRMQRMRLQRNHPDLDDVQIDDLMREWMLDRPGAEHGDCAGPVSLRNP